MVTLKGSGADTFFNITTPKFAAQAIKKAAEIGWKPTHYLNNVSTSVGSVLTPAGPGERQGHHHRAATCKDPTDPQWARTTRACRTGWPGWTSTIPSGDMKDGINVYGYSVAKTLVQVLKQCGDNLTRENVMKQAASLDMTLPMLLPGINVKTGPDDFYPIEREQLRALQRQDLGAVRQGVRPGRELTGSVPMAKPRGESAARLFFRPIEWVPPAPHPSEGGNPSHCRTRARYSSAHAQAPTLHRTVSLSVSSA